VLLDASDQGIAHDLGVNYAPKLGNLAIGDPAAVQTVTLDSPTPDQNKSARRSSNFQGAPDFSPTRIAQPGPKRLPACKLPAGRCGRSGLQPVHPDRRLADGVQRADRRDRDGPFDVVRHTNTGDRVLGIHIAGPSAPGQFAESWSTSCSSRASMPTADHLYISTETPASP